MWRRVIDRSESWWDKRKKHHVARMRWTSYPANGRMSPMNAKSDTRPWQEREHQCAILLFDRPAMFETAVAIEVWGNDRTAQGVPYSEVRVCSNEGPRLRVDVGFDIHLDHDLAALEWADTIVLPNGGRPARRSTTNRLCSTRTRAAYATAGPGSFRFARVRSFFGATGLLDERQATTHWTYVNQFRARHPSVELLPNALYVGDDRLYTSAGTSAAIDLCLHFVREDWGARWRTRSPGGWSCRRHRDGGQAQFVEQPIPSSSRVDADLRAVLQWVERNLDRQLSVETGTAGGHDPADVRPTVQGGDRDHAAAVDPPSARRRLAATCSKPPVSGSRRSLQRWGSVGRGDAPALHRGSSAPARARTARCSGAADRSVEPMRVRPTAQTGSAPARRSRHTGT